MDRSPWLGGGIRVSDGFASRRAFATYRNLLRLLRKLLLVDSDEKLPDSCPPQLVSTASTSLAIQEDPEPDEEDRRCGDREAIAMRGVLVSSRRILPGQGRYEPST